MAKGGGNGNDGRIGTNVSAEINQIATSIPFSIFGEAIVLPLFRVLSKKGKNMKPRVARNNLVWG